MSIPGRRPPKRIRPSASRSSIATPTMASMARRPSISGSMPSPSTRTKPIATPTSPKARMIRRPAPLMRSGRSMAGSSRTASSTRSFIPARCLPWRRSSPTDVRPEVARHGRFTASVRPVAIPPSAGHTVVPGNGRTDARHGGVPQPQVRGRSARPCSHSALAFERLRSKTVTARQFATDECADRGRIEQGQRSSAASGDA